MLIHWGNSNTESIILIVFTDELHGIPVIIRDIIRISGSVCFPCSAAGKPGNAVYLAVKRIIRIESIGIYIQHRVYLYILQPAVFGAFADGCHDGIGLCRAVIHAEEPAVFYYSSKILCGNKF